MSVYESRERRRSEQINREFYVRGRPQNRLPQTIIETANEVNFTESNDRDRRQNNDSQQQFLTQSLQRRFHSETDIRTQRQSDVQVDHTVIDIDYDDITDRHIHSLTAGMGSNWTIADP